MEKGEAEGYNGPLQKRHWPSRGPEACLSVCPATAAPLLRLALRCRAGGGVEQGRSSREAVLADANALLACYGVGEESGAELTHAVVELLFTTSIE